MSAQPQWIQLDGAVNVRDLGGLPTAAGPLRSGRLIRSDNLQGLSDRDVQRLVGELRVRSVADLRTHVEVDSEGPGPLTREPLVSIKHLSLFPESGTVAEVAETADGPVVLPWHERDAALGERRSAAGVYLGYLDQRPDSVLAALRLIATTDGATIVHCAAGKDRTGVVVALALAEVGVDRDEIVADFARTGERIDAILARLAASPTYEGDIDTLTPGRHTPRPATMATFLAELDEGFGGPSGWLRASGWTESDAAALRGVLLGP